MSGKHLPHPGLAKAQPSRLLRRKRVDLVAVDDGPLRAVLEAADVVSEGLARVESSGLVYYGSTSVLLPARSRGGILPDAELDALGAVLGRDPHVRVAAVRIAQREAQTRAQGELGPLRAEISVRVDETGVAVVVDVVADVVGTAASGGPR